MAFQLPQTPLCLMLVHQLFFGAIRVICPPPPPPRCLSRPYWRKTRPSQGANAILCSLPMRRMVPESNLGVRHRPPKRSGLKCELNCALSTANSYLSTYQTLYHGNQAYCNPYMLNSLRHSVAHSQIVSLSPMGILRRLRNNIAPD
jgi:hypothetical protein